MDIDPRDTIDSNFKIIPPETTRAFVFLSQQSWLADSHWYLAGGTALALQVGNRESVDLDFFTTDQDFDTRELVKNFSGNAEWGTTINKKNTLYGQLFSAKISFIAYPFFIPQQNRIQYGSINILAVTDIAVMKIIAVSQRGRKRDFFDLYWCAHHIESLDNLIKKLPVQYPSVAHDYNHILKSLVYFDDAESDPEPELYFKATWKEVKDFFEKEIPKITAEIIGLK
jgi:predicted nucleotidyltransferase component of viral defense system